MREIKFRVWNFIHNKMLYSLLYYGNDPVNLCKPSLDDCDYRHVLMQYTGLKDREGKEIYEGDILQWIGLAFPITVDDFHGYRFMWGKDQLCRAFAIDGKVIGNIYENPELLE